MNDDEILGPDETTMRWFGPVQPVRLGVRTQVPTPVGAECGHCDVLIADGDQGYQIPHLSLPPTVASYHLDCFMRSLLGPGWRELMSENEPS